MSNVAAPVAWFMATSIRSPWHHEFFGYVSCIGLHKTQPKIAEPFTHESFYSVCFITKPSAELFVLILNRYVQILFSLVSLSMIIKECNIVGYWVLVTVLKRGCRACKNMGISLSQFSWNWVNIYTLKYRKHIRKMHV